MRMSRSRACNSRSMGAESAVYASAVWVRRAASRNRFSVVTASSARSYCSEVAIIHQNLHHPAWDHLTRELRYAQPGHQVLSTDRLSRPEHISLKQQPGLRLVKHIALRWQE